MNVPNANYKRLCQACGRLARLVDYLGASVCRPCKYELSAGMRATPKDFYFPAAYPGASQLPTLSFPRAGAVPARRREAPAFSTPTANSGRAAR